MPAGTASLTINLGDEHSKPFKSIDRVTWSDIPEFAVLTGPNGSGKTQLLQAIAYKLTNVSHPQYKAELDNMPMTTTIGIEPHEVAYLPSSESSFRLQGASISNIVNAKRQFLGQLTPQQTQYDIDKQILREMVARRFGIRVEHQQHITEDQLN
jgi:ABC-type Mn2+/Zn2+ transport system ATPase subunit